MAENTRLEQIETHLKRLKENSIEDGRKLDRIEQALVGNHLNGNKGLVTDVESIKEKVEQLEDFEGEVKVYIRQLKWAFGVLTGVFSIAIIWIIKNIKL